MDAPQAEPHKILVAVPTTALQPDPNVWLKSFLNVLNSIRANGLTHAPMFVYRDNWFSAMNKFFNVAFSHGFDYILRMDDDVWGVGHDYFTKLYKANVDVIGALYPTRYFPYAYAALNKVDKTKDILEAHKNKENNFKEVDSSITGIQEVDLIGFGMTLIKVEPFRMVSRPLFPDVEICPDDTYFAKICADNGIKQHVHMDLKMCHRDVTPMNRIYLQNADARMMLQNKLIGDLDTSDFANRMRDCFGPDGKKDLDKLVCL